MKIYAVRIGNRYDERYENYLEQKLPEYDFHWIREERDPKIKLQWNKIFAMDDNSDEPICVMDIDVLLINDYKKIFEFPIEKGQFAVVRNWWKFIPPGETPEYTINGGFYKFYPKETKYIYEKFLAKKTHWQRIYIEQGYTTGPINGEQNFVEDAVKEKLEMIYLPSAWFTRIDGRPTEYKSHTISNINTMYKKASGNPYAFLGDEFHPDIKFVHFTHMDNLPHMWDKYSLFV
jgi:hypothetical protein